ncbi:hypothetical protein GCM10023189_57250 [Nibrella saemangeumensis]|uniref:Quercetin 2,3-dioxygenase C-terminal cupin domain-containing protein n=1 Tax=Nibrella saemangeumensis TaxID=1084526 RepID=A0ABP8NQQ2_9BACT
MNTHAQIYLADQRGCSETDFFRSYHTFNFGQYADESRKPFGALYLLNDDTLRAGASLSLQVEQNTQVVLLPVLGGLEYLSDIDSGFLEAGQAGILSLAAGMRYTISNPYDQETINFLQWWLIPPIVDFTPGISQAGFDLSRKNTLLPLVDSTSSKADSRSFIGRYDGRQEGTYTVTVHSKATGIFVFIIQGAFEVANRLLHEKDGLALLYEKANALEFEALSNDALLLLLDLPVTG